MGTTVRDVRGRPRGGPLLLLAVVVSGPLVVGCAGPLRQWGDEISTVTKSSTLSDWKLDGESVGILSATVAFGKEGYILPVSRSLSAALSEEGHRVKVVPVEATLSGINRNGLASLHATMMSEYHRTGILDRDVLEQVGRAIGARYVILPTMAMFEQSTHGRMALPFIGMRLFQTRISYLRLSAEMWDTSTGELVCDASGEGTLAVEDVREKRVPFEEIAAQLWQRILEVMNL